MGVLGGGQTVYVEKVYVLFPSLTKALDITMSQGYTRCTLVGLKS